tara:strand:- start:2987 stop:4060 length:1074 start_codon:yes stop_codon:yes gene_type:complete
MRNIFKKIYKKLIETFFKCLYGNISIGKDHSSISEIEVRDKLFESNKYFIYLINDGIIYTDNVQNVSGISNNKLHIKPSFQHGRDKIISPKHNPVLRKGLTNFRKTYKGNVLSLVQGASTENYFHWLMDILPKIKIFSSKFSINKIDYFYLGRLALSQKQSLKYLGIKNNKIIDSTKHKHILAKKLFFVSHPWYTKGKFHDQSHNLPKWEIIWLKKTFLSFRKKFKVGKKIYIDRSESKYSHCQIINDLELKKYLIKKNFEILKLSNLSFSKQIFMFWNLRCIIGAHGAALTNLVFCRPKTKVIELKPFGHPGKNYQRISKINNLNYHSIVSEKKFLKKKNGDIFVDLKKLDKIIKL